MKKLPTSLIIVLLLAACFTGCGSFASGDQRQAADSTPETAQLQKKPVLHMAHFINANKNKPYDTGMSELLKLYTEQTGVDIKLTIIPWDQIDEKLLIANQAGEPEGDVVALSSQKLQHLVNERVLLPLDPWFNASFTKEDFSPLVIQAGTSAFDGKLYALLQAIDVRGLWYNKKYITHPPETLNELVTTAKKVTDQEKGIYGLGFWGGTHYGAVEGTISMLTWAHGGRLSNSDGSAAWNNSAVEKAIRFMSDCVNVYRISPENCITLADYSEVQEMFYNGKIAMLMDGSFAYSNNEFKFDSIEYFGFAPMPGVDGPAENFSNGWAWGIPSTARQPELAWQFIEWFEGKEIQTKHALIMGSLPTRTSALEDPAFSEKGFFPQMIANLNKYGRPMDSFVYYQEALEEIASIESIYCLDPSTDLKQMLEDSQKLFNQKYYNN